MRRRFSPNSVASSDGDHTRVSHDRRANATGRSEYAFCGHKVIITNNNVFRDGNWIGHLYIDDHGQKYVYGPSNKGRIKTIASSIIF
jgi:hypothetical protein